MLLKIGNLYKNKTMKKIFLLLIITIIAGTTPDIYTQDCSSKDLLSLKKELLQPINIKTGEKGSAVNLNLKYQSEFQKKKTGLAIIYSMLLPGMGELYAESYSSGKYFTIAEGTLWGIYLGMNTYANWQKNRYISFAESNGGVNINGKNDEYFGTISEYIDVKQYNDQKALERSYDEMYNESQYYWQWTNEDRRRYRSMWVSSEQSYNNLRFVVGALILNRVVSAINAVRLVSAYNKRSESEIGWNLSVGVSDEINLPPGLSVSFQTEL